MAISAMANVMRITKLDLLRLREKCSEASVDMDVVNGGGKGGKKKMFAADHDSTDRFVFRSDFRLAMSEVGISEKGDDGEIMDKLFTMCVRARVRVRVGFRVADVATTIAREAASKRSLVWSVRSRRVLGVAPRAQCPRQRHLCLSFSLFLPRRLPSLPFLQVRRARRRSDQLPGLFGRSQSIGVPGGRSVQNNLRLSSVRP